MSEPSQLYARLHLSRHRLDEFLETTIPDPSGDAELLAWLADAEYYGERFTPDLIRERVNAGITIGAWVDDLMTPAPHGVVMPARNVYDEESQTWTLGALDFSETTTTTSPRLRSSRGSERQGSGGRRRLPDLRVSVRG